MKITGVRTEVYEWPRPQVHYSGRQRGKQAYTTGGLRLVLVDTDEGITGIGSCFDVTEVEKLGQKIIGMDPLCNELI